MNDQQKRIDDLEREVAELERELKAAQETLHDQYTMAVLTGLLASGEYAPEGALTEARTAADAAMKARQV